MFHYLSLLASKGTVILCHHRSCVAFLFSEKAFLSKCPGKYSCFYYNWSSLQYVPIATSPILVLFFFLALL